MPSRPRAVLALLCAAALLAPAAPAHAGDAVPTGGASHGDGVWRRLETTGTGPSDRSAPAAAGVGAAVYVFGGVFDEFVGAGNVFLDDLYRLDTRTGHWQRLEPVTAPPARAFAAAAAYQPTGRMFLFGGSTFSNDGSEFTPFGDLWYFATRSGAWQRVQPVGDGPGARSGAVMWQRGDSLYVFGGLDATFATRNDLWAYHLRDNRWELLSADGDPSAPPPRHVAQAGQSAPGGVLTLYGGEGLDPQVGFTVLADTWQYDLAAGTWREVSPVPDIAPPRNYGAAAVLGHSLYLHGGDTPGGSAGCGAPFPQNPTDQLWRFDLASRQWRELDPAGDPLPRLKRHAAATVRGTAYLVSGWDFQCEADQGPGQVWNREVYAFTP